MCARFNCLPNSIIESKQFLLHVLYLKNLTFFLLLFFLSLFLFSFVVFLRIVLDLVFVDFCRHFFVFIALMVYIVWGFMHLDTFFFQFVWMNYIHGILLVFFFCRSKSAHTGIERGEEGRNLKWHQNVWLGRLFVASWVIPFPNRTHTAYIIIMSKLTDLFM